MRLWRRWPIVVPTASASRSSLHRRARSALLAAATGLVCLLLSGCSMEGLLGWPAGVVRAQPWPPPGGMGAGPATPLPVESHLSSPAGGMGSTAVVHAPAKFTAAPTATPAARPDLFNARFLADVSLPDHAVVSPGVTLIKTWRIVNTGTRPWDSHDALVLQPGADIQAPARVPLPAARPGASVEVSVPVVLPSSPGTVTARWRLMMNGTPFGPPLTLSVAVRAPSPSATPSPAHTATPSTYTVQKGDTLYSLSRRFHLSAAELARHNDLPNAERLRTGQVLRLPETTPTAAAVTGGH